MDDGSGDGSPEEALMAGDGGAMSALPEGRREFDKDVPFLVAVETLSSVRMGLCTVFPVDMHARPVSTCCLTGLKSDSHEKIISEAEGGGSGNCSSSQ